jgi:DNA-directed RNA polymerase specialized sigma24 family protein
LLRLLRLLFLPHPHLPQYGGVMSHLSTLASPQVTTATHVKSVVSLAQPKLIAPLQDFQCFLLAFAKNLQLNELTISTDGAIISYINKAIYHHYIALSKAKRHQLPTVSIESQTDYDPLQFDTAFSESDTYNNLLLLDLKRALSTEEYHVIYDHYFRQYSIQEIATRDNKSRQAINKCKKTAIIKLRRYFGVTS